DGSLRVVDDQPVAWHPLEADVGLRPPYIVHRQQFVLLVAGLLGVKCRSAATPRNHDIAERHLDLDFWQHDDMELGLDLPAGRPGHHLEDGKANRLNPAIDLEKTCIAIEGGGK